jgi:hypothetical protein
VTLVSADMRHWQAPEQADILVSELLGSFGDNELSPECLDGGRPAAYGCWRCAAAGSAAPRLLLHRRPPAASAAWTLQRSREPGTQRHAAYVPAFAGAQRFLKPDGISIPSAYTSYLSPITSSKLWNDVRAYKDLKHFETPYVVKFHKCAACWPAGLLACWPAGQLGPGWCGWCRSS